MLLSLCSLFFFDYISLTWCISKLTVGGDVEITTLNIGLTIVNVLLVVGNLIVLGFSLKLYTELMKDKNMSNRMKKGSDNV